MWRKVQVIAHCTPYEAKNHELERCGNVWLPRSLKSELKQAVSLVGYAVVEVPSSARSSRLEAGMVCELERRTKQRRHNQPGSDC